MAYRKLGTRDPIAAEIIRSAVNRASGPEKAHATRAEAVLAEAG